MRKRGLKIEAYAAATPVHTSFFGRNKRSKGVAASPFYISHEVLTDQEDDPFDTFESPDPSHDGNSSSSDNGEDLWSKEKHKDDIRKYHALLELLSTEVSYLRDLKALITVGN